VARAFLRAPGRITVPLVIALSALPGCSKPADSTCQAAAAKTLRLSMIATTDPGKLAREAEPLGAAYSPARGSRRTLSRPDRTVPSPEARALEGEGR